MLFPTFEFFYFFTLVLILNWSLKRWPIAWRLFLLLSSYYFYSVWDINFLLILVAISVFNFFSALLIDKTILGLRKFLLFIAVLVNLLALGFFKYYDFFRVSTELLLRKFGFLATLPLLEIILPLGLSFYVFRAISYNIDVYRRKIAATFSLLDFLIYISFFPQILSGPVARAGDFLAQLKDGGAKKIENFYHHLTLIFLGLFKKLVISSYLVLSITDDVFAVPENHSQLVLLLAVFAYSIVIYFDFSGYSDMAIGFAGLLGFKTPINFDTPYLSSNIKDFWRRWHISISDWMRDYVYIPLGGNRKGLIRKYFNLMIVMFLVGLWHGTNHFIIWGAINGIALIIFNLYQDIKDRSFIINIKPVEKWREDIFKFFGGFFTFIFVSFSWIFFRSESTENSIKFLKSLFDFSKNSEPFKIHILILLFIGFFVFLFEKQIIKKLTNIQQRLPAPLLILFSVLVMILILKLGPDIIPPFIYFNF